MKYIKENTKILPVDPNRIFNHLYLLIHIYIHTWEYIKLTCQKIKKIESHYVALSIINFVLVMVQVQK
jgi:hypothetical protein